MTIRRIRNHWCVDIRYEKQRYRRQCPINSRQAAQKYEKTLWGKLICGEPLDPPPPKAPTPIFRSFAAHWFETFVRTNNKHSEQRTKESTLRCHLLPWFGHLRIDSIGPQQF